jgi:hypothetical protein
MVVPDANRFRRGACSNQSCGFSTLGRSGTCCRKAIRTTKPCIVGFSHGAHAATPRSIRYKRGIHEEVAGSKTARFMESVV